MRTHTSRRGFIGGAGLLAAGSLAPVAAAATEARATHNSARLTRLIALHDRVNAECERFDDEVETPAREAWAAAIEAYPAEMPPPHEESRTSFVNVFGDAVRLSTSQIGVAANARKIVSDPTWSEVGGEDWRQAHREIADAFDRRNAILAEQAARRSSFEASARERYRIDAITAWSNNLDDRRVSLWQAAVASPAASLADVLAKLAFIDRTTATDEIEGDVFAAISVDIRRLAEEA